jgi:hypothetical protein
MAFGITTEYRKTDEYKNWVSLIQAENPELPLYLVEMGIAIHKNDPKVYKKASKEEKKKLTKHVMEEKSAEEFVLNTVIVSDPIDITSVDITSADNNISVYIKCLQERSIEL